MENQVLEYLRSEPRFRERHNKDRGIANLLIEKYHLDIEKSRLTAVIQDANSMDRYWRKLTAENPDLRGKDYDTKRIVEERKQMDLGYESGYYSNINSEYA
jgi:hypothetical protein